MAFMLYKLCPEAVLILTLTLGPKAVDRLMNSSDSGANHWRCCRLKESLRQVCVCVYLCLGSGLAIACVCEVYAMCV